MSVLLVVDEWIWEEEILRNQEKRDKIFQFLIKLYEKCDRLIIVEPSPFVDKFYTLCERYNQAHDQGVRSIIKLFIYGLLYNSEKCIKYEQTELQVLPKEIEKEVKEDDHYLVRAYLTAQASILITTDTHLIETASKYSINCKHLDEFLSWYMNGKS